ncbi:MAG: hypothetical protein MRJ93_13015 [Nitrososphaeraceae archaeon]|nr:hypothetical protein [Nitrososphaeraceae archaeon]
MLISLSSAILLPFQSLVPVPSSCNASAVAASDLSSQTYWLTSTSFTSTLLLVHFIF